MARAGLRTAGPIRASPGRTAAPVRPRRSLERALVSIVKPAERVRASLRRAAALVRLRVLVCQGFRAPGCIGAAVRSTTATFYEQGTEGDWWASECKSKLAASSAVTASCMQRVFAGVALLILNIAADSLALLLSPITALEVTLDKARYVCLLGREAVEASGSRGWTAAATIARRRIRMWQAFPQARALPHIQACAACSSRPEALVRSTWHTIVWQTPLWPWVCTRALKTSCCSRLTHPWCMAQV